MAPHRRRAVPTSDPTLAQRVRKSFATEAAALIEEAEKAIATAGDTLSAGGKLNPLQGAVASAIHGSNVTPKPKKTGPSKLEDENGEAIRATANVSPATAPISFAEKPMETPSVARAAALEKVLLAVPMVRKKVDPDSTEGKALELYVEQLVNKFAPPEDPPESEQLPRDCEEPCITAKSEDGVLPIRKSMFCEFVKVEKAEEKQIVLGIVLAPEEVDAQLDIYDAEVIEQAAHKFLANYNAGTKMGHLHKEFNRPLDLVESYIAPTDFKLKGREITKGTWMMAVKVKDPTLWEKVKNGELTGFSIGGTAKVQKLGTEA